MYTCIGSVSLTIHVLHCNHPSFLWVYIYSDMVSLRSKVFKELIVVYSFATEIIIIYMYNILLVLCVIKYKKQIPNYQHSYVKSRLIFSCRWWKCWHGEVFDWVRGRSEFTRTVQSYPSIQVRICWAHGLLWSTSAAWCWSKIVCRRWANTRKCKWKIWMWESEFLDILFIL